MTIRSAHPREFPRIADLQTESWRANYRAIFTDEFLDHRLAGILQDHWSAIRLGSHDLVLVEGREDILGFIAVQARDGPLVTNLHVRPPAQSQGIGRRLMIAAARRLIDDGYSSASLWVAETNGRAIDFYSRLGGRLTERATKEHFGENIAAVKIQWDALSDLLARDRMDGVQERR